MAEVRLTPAAKSHLLDIWAYTESTWGEDQADEYLRQLAAAFERLGANPCSGLSRPEIGPGYRSLPVKKHVIFYTVSSCERYVNVLGVLHARMDVAPRLP